MTICDAVTVGDTVPIGLAINNRLLSFDWCFIGLDVEVDEEEQVAGQEEASEDSSRLGSRAGAIGRQRGEVGGSVVRVGAEIDHKQINDKLGDLHGGQMFLPPDASSSSGGIVVVVHDDMDSEVDRDGDPLDTSLAIKLRIA